MSTVSYSGIIVPLIVSLILGVSVILIFELMLLLIRCSHYMFGLVTPGLSLGVFMARGPCNIQLHNSVYYLSNSTNTVT